MDLDQFNPGGVPDVKDKRDWIIGQSTAPKAVSIYMPDQPFKSIMYDQGTTPFCGPHALAWMMAYLESLNDGDTKNFAPRYTTIKDKLIDGYSLDAGTDMRSLFKVARSSGAIDFKHIPGNIGVTLQQYADSSVITPDMDKEGSEHTADNFAVVSCETFEDIAQAIQEHKAVLLLVDFSAAWYSDIYGNRSFEENDILPLRPIYSPTSHHFVVAHSNDVNRIYFANSFGTDWGRGGHGYFERNFVNLGNVIQAGVINVPKDHPGLVIPSKYTFTSQMGMYSVGPQVYNLQQRLIAEKVATFSVPTGVFFTKTFESVKNYQVKYGITPVTGFVGPKTLAQLNK